MAADCAMEVKKHGVTVVSLWPGAVKTENMLDALAKETDYPQDISEEEKAVQEKQKQGMVRKM